MSTIDVRLINPFLVSTQQVLAAQAKTSITLGKPRLRTEADGWEVGLACVINLTSNLFNGTLAVCFPEAVFLSVYERTGENAQPLITREVEDTAAELLNMIYASAKVEFDKIEDLKIERGLPTIARGQRLNPLQYANPAIVVPLSADLGEFFFQISTARV